MAEADDGRVLEAGEVGAEPTAEHSLDVRHFHELVRAEAEEAEAENPDGPETEAPIGDEEDTEAPAEPSMVACPLCGTGEVDPIAALDHLGTLVKILQPFKQSAAYATCDGCDGWGSILTGSALPEQSVAPCPECDGAGYVAAALRVAPAEHGHEPVELEQVGWDQQPDLMRLSPSRGGIAPAPGMEWNPQQGSWAYPPAPASV